MDSVNLAGGAGQSVAAEELDGLREFRGRVYRCLGRRRDELFELTDALLCAEGPVQSLVGLCLAPEHRRGHGALYDGLNCGTVDADRLRAELTGLPLPRMFGGRIVLAVDGSGWLRPDAATCPDRLFCHVYGRGRDADARIPGWPYQVVAALESGPTSWTAVLDAVRLGPAEDATAVTADQLPAVVGRLRAAGHWRVGDPPIMVVLDSGYDVARLAFVLADLPVQLVGRIRADRVMLATTPPRPVDGPGPMGRPRRHGAVMALADPDSWPAPTTQTQTATARYGKAEATCWGRDAPAAGPPRLLGRSPRHPADPRGHPHPAGRGAPARSAGGQARLAVDLGHRDRRGGGDPLLAGLPAPIRPGAHLPPLEETLGWTAPKIRSPQAADRWTWLVIAAHTQLRLARHLAVDLRRPREKPLPPERLTPARVRRGFRHLRAKISQPARAPKPTHPGPGRPPGVKNRHRATRYDVGKTVTRATANTSAQQVGG